MSENKFEINSKEEVAFKLYESLKIPQEGELHSGEGVAVIGKKSYTIAQKEANLKIFSLILSVVKGEIKGEEIKLQDFFL